MEFEQLSFWSQEIGEAPEIDIRPIPNCPSVIYSPMQGEYGSYLEMMEMELLQGVVGESVTEDREANGTAAAAAEDEEHDDDPGRGSVDDGTAADEGILGGSGCKNLLSERNRRKRLNQQLLALRSLVPCISKMDKRSILMDAATYVQNLHKEIEQIKREVASQETSESSTTSSEPNLPSQDVVQQCQDSSPTKHQILNIDIEEMDEQTFTVKLVLRKARGAVSQVLHMVESLGFNISNTWTHEVDRHQMITTSFLQVKKPASLTAETLKVHINKAAFKFGFDVDIDD